MRREISPPGLQDLVLAATVVGMKARKVALWVIGFALVFGLGSLLACQSQEGGKTHEATREATHQTSHGDSPEEHGTHDQRAKGADQYVARALPASKQQGFDSACKGAWLEESDRIVFPDQKPPVGHLHRGYGTDVNYDSLLSEMHNSTSNCNRPEDTAGYWTPALQKPDGTEVRVQGFKSYYRTDVPASQLHYPPENLKLIAGDRLATSPQSKQITSWNCKGVEKNDVEGPFTEPTNCSSADAKPRVKVTFPQCLAVRKTSEATGATIPLVDSEDHKSHAAYPTKTDSGTYRCPDTHPYAVVRVGYQISYYPRSDPRGADMSKVTLASGGRYSMHADFWQSFRMTGDNSIRALTERCFEAPGTFCKLGNNPQ